MSRFPAADTPEAELARLAEQGLLRTPRRIDGAQTAEILVDGRSAANFSSNNYLGLADDAALLQAALQASSGQGFGSGASRLIAGNLSAHRALEARLAEWKGTEAALLFNSGYQANLGIVSAIAGPEDALFSDALNHASLIDGARLSRARIHVYPHRDVAALDSALKEASGGYRRRLILTDSVFSMDGDAAPLGDLVAVAQRHRAITIVDEAHAVGVLGASGVGLSGGLAVDLQMGTLGKALGGFGAYVAGRRAWIDLLYNRARSFVFTTALPVPVVAWAQQAIDRVSGIDGDARRARLRAVSARFHAGLTTLGLAPAAPSHIVPIRVGPASLAMELCEELLARGVFAQGIRPPTVPAGTSRLRFAMMATHTDEQIDRAIGALAQIRARLM